MVSLSIGPLAFPVAPLLLLVAFLAASFAAGRLAPRAPPAAGADSQAAAPPPTPAARARDAVFHAALAGLLAARLAHLALHASAYLAAPWSALDVRDGGWHAPSGAAVAAGWLAWQAWRRPPLRRALGAAALAGAAVWTLGVGLTGGFDGDADRPTLALRRLDAATSTTLAAVAADRPQVVNLWATWCGPCRAEMPMLAQAQARQPGVSFAFVNQGESDAAVRAYLAHTGLALRDVLLDAPSALGRAVGSSGLPTTLFYDACGRLVKAHVGLLSGPALAARLAGLPTPSRC